MALIIFCKLVLRNEPYIQVTQVLTLLFLECKCLLQFHIFGDELWLCSGRTHLMLHWNPITASTKQNELLLTWAAATESEVGGRNPPCWGDFWVFLLFFCLILIPLALISEMLLFGLSGSENTTWPYRPVLQSRKHAISNERRGDLQTGKDGMEEKNTQTVSNHIAMKRNKKYKWNECNKKDVCFPTNCHLEALR